jgi:hypothetical protein
MSAYQHPAQRKAQGVTVLLLADEGAEKAAAKISGPTLNQTGRQARNAFSH